MANLLFLLPAILALLVPRPSVAINPNYMLSGETLPTDGRLTSGDTSFVMQGDCNLVLYSDVFWMSNTANHGHDCVLSLNNNGVFTIHHSKGGGVVWTSPHSSVTGDYAAVLTPAGIVNIYGPAVWSSRPKSSAAATADNSALHANMASNALFSGQFLYDDAKLINKNFEFVMQGDCNAVLYGGRGWQSNTHGNGQHCFLRLDHKGTLHIKDDDYKTVWSSGKASTLGYYVLLLQDDGRLVVYGPVVWSSKPTSVTQAGSISMVTGSEKSN